MPQVITFEKYPRECDSRYEKTSTVYESEMSAIKELRPITGPGVEIGVSTGRFAHTLGIEFGVDPSRRMIEIAQQRGIKVIAGVAEKLPLRNDWFNLTLMITNSCFLDDLHAAFTESYRVLKSGGHFLVGFIDGNSPLGKSYQQHKHESRFYQEANFYFTFFIGTVKEVWAGGNWAQLLSWKIVLSVVLFIFSFFIPPLIKRIKPL